MPAISVLLPVRNALPWLHRSLASLWRQTFRDFEVIAVDDGSTDGSGAWLDAAAAAEPRLRALHTGPLGLPAALNLALREARAPVIARMDADDLIARTRFAIQHAHLVAHRDVAVVGSRVRLFPHAAVGQGMARWVTWHNALLTHEHMARELLIDSPLVHGTAMLRRDWLERVGGWTSQAWPEDLDLWIRMIDSGARLAKRPETLYAWRQHARSATRMDPRYRLESFQELKLDTLARRFGDAPPTVLGVGASLGRWHDLLRRRWPDARRVEVRSPSASVLAALSPPILLVLVAYQRRDVWRTAMLERGLVEQNDFTFIA